ncbi:lysosomal-trafficking regulator-like isoform X2 [Babylonia areolata]|uniref:lysosomal-trafficking regulator-like isoform X2 n=1 Tax=Babylonia areolata TaxID=304850 RepID=UPI003FD4F70D
MLSEMWETYAQLSRRLPDKETSASLQKRQILLDRFLLQFLHESSSDKSTNLCEMRNVSNELSHEFMHNILRVTNSAADVDDITDLENYLLGGRGWMLLYTIRRVGTQGVYSRHDLCNILLTLLPFCLRLRQNENKNSFLHLSGVDPQVSVSQCFQLVENQPRLHRSAGYNFKGLGDLKKHSSHYAGGEKKHYTKTLSSTSRQKVTISESDQEDMDVRENKQPRLRKTMRTHILTSLGKEEESTSEEDFVDHAEDIDLTGMSIGSCHLFQLILHLLEDLVVVGVTHAVSSQSLSPVILPVLLDVLQCFSHSSGRKSGQSAEGVEDTVVLPWVREDGLILLQQLVRLILTLSGVVATQHNGVRILLSMKVVPSILLSLRYCHPQAEGCDAALSAVEQIVVKDTVCGCLDLFRVIFNHLPFNPTFVRDANAVMELFRRHGGEDYFRFLFVENDRQHTDKKHSAAEGHDSPVKWLCNLIHCLKVVKVNYIHAVKCLKRRHRGCEYGIFFHHHHDIFGAPLELVVTGCEESSHVQTKLADPSLCQMAKWSCLLLDCLKKAQAKSTKLLILCALRDEGMCCCLQPASVVNILVPLLPELSPAVKNYALETLNTMLLDQFGGAMENVMACSQCSLEKPVNTLHIDSGFASSDVGEDLEQKSLLRWRSLRLLRKYVLSVNESIALSVSRHLITLAVRGNRSIREELFFGIYLHVLNMKTVEQPMMASGKEREEVISSSEEGVRMGSMPNTVLLLCVSSLPYVLQVDKVMRLFLEKGGLACLTHLLDNEQLRLPVMGVFEALIMIDEQTMMNRHIPATSASSKHSVGYQGGIVIQTFIDTLARKTCAITASLQQHHLKGPLSKSLTRLPNRRSPTNKGTRDVPDEATFPASADQETSFVEIHKCVIETVPALQDMWKTCAKLCMNSETFRICYRNSPCLYIVQETLVLALSILSEFSPTAVSGSGGQQCRKEQQQDSQAKNPSSLACHFSHLSFIESVMVVCFSCQTILPLQQEGEEEEMWLRVRSTLEQCVELEPSKLRAVFDMLLNAAQPQLPSILEYSYAQITSSLNQQDVEELDDEDEVKKIAHHWSDEEFECLYTEQGYEADTETNLQDDWHKEIEGRLTGPGGGLATVQCFPAVLRLFVELLVASQNTASGQAVLIPVLLRLLHMLRSSHATTTAACKQGLLELILKGFQSVFLQTEKQQQCPVLYEILLTTIQVLGQVEISSSELGFLFRFFHQTQDVDSILSILTSIVENSWVAPSAYLTFPVSANRWYSHLDYTLPQDPQSATSVWSVSAVQCAVKNLQWPPFEEGFSLALWLSLESLSSTSTAQAPHAVNPDRESTAFVPALQDCVHLASLGDSTKMFEVWVHVATATLLVRLTSLKSTSTALREAVLSLNLSYLDWHNIVFSYVDTLDGSTSLGKLTVRVDGLVRHESVLDHPASMWHCPVSNATPSLILGHSARHKMKRRVGHYSLGPVLLFTDCNLSSEWWFHLYALGPTFGGLGKCDCGFPRVSYAGLLTRDLLRNNSLNQDMLAGSAPVVDLEKAVMSQVLYLDPQSWKTYCSFGHSAERGGSSLLGLVPSASSADPLLRQCPLVDTSNVSGDMKLTQHVNLPQALEQLGSLQALLFLVAKVFEQRAEGGGGEEEEQVKGLDTQSKAVHLLLTLLHRFPPLTVTFSHMQGYEMLAVVLRSSRSPVTYSLIKVLFDAATSESIFKLDGVSGRLLLRTSSESVIRDVNVISQLLLCWQIWQRADDSVMEFILSGLVVLVRGDHPHHSFNVKQLQAAGVVKLLFHMYLERIQEDAPALSGVCGQHVATIVASVVGRPPDLALLASVTDFLLQLYPPSTRFINYTPSAFYLHPVWWSDEEPGTSALQDRLKKAGESRGETVKMSDTVQQALDDDKEMEHVQFHTQRSRSTEASWDSLEGSEISEEDLATHSKGPPSVSPQYPPLEAALESNVRSYCLGENAENGRISGDASGSSSEGTYEVESPSQSSHQQCTSTDNDDHAKVGLHKSETERTDLTGTKQQDMTSSTSERENGEFNNEEMIPVFKKDEQSTDESDDSEESEEVEKKSDRTGANKLWKSAMSEKDGQQTVNGSDSLEESRSDASHQRGLGGDRPTSTSSFTHNPGQRTGDGGGSEEGLETLCLSLLQYLWKVVMEQPVETMTPVFCQVINPHALLVLAQSPSSAVRIAVTQVVNAYLWRAPVVMLEEFLREDGLYLLANQLGAYPVCQQQVEVALSLLMQHAFTFQHHFMVGDLGQVNELQQVAPVLVLSMLCGTLLDVALCHNTLTVLAQVIESSHVMSKVLIDLGLPDTLCNLVYTTQRYHASATDLEGMDSGQLILLDIQNIFCLLAVAEFSWSGVAHYQQVEYMFTILQAMEDKEKTRGESGVKRAETARALQFAMVVRILDCVQSLSLDVSRASNSWLNAQSTGVLESRATSASPMKAFTSSLMTASSIPHLSSGQPGKKVNVPQVSLTKPPLLRSVHSLPHLAAFLSNADSLYAMVERSSDDTSSGGSHAFQRSTSEDGKQTLLQRLFGRKKKLEYSCLTQSELLERFKKFLVMAVDLAVFQERQTKVKPVLQHTLNFLAEPSIASLDDRFLKHLFTTVYQALALTVSKDQYHKRARNPIMFSARDVLRVQCGRLLTCMMSPRMEFDQRIFTVSYLMGESCGREVVRLLAGGQHVSTELGLHVHDLLSVWRDWLNPNQRDLVLVFLTLLRQCGCNITSPDLPSTPDQADTLKEQKKSVEFRLSRDQQSWRARRTMHQDRVRGRFEEVMQRVQGHAMALTQRMTAQQTRERGSLVEHIKHTMAQQVQLKKNWQDIVHSLTHERGVWHDEESYPQSWELDPTEGPGRIRRRLMRCHLGLQSKYVRPSLRQKLACQEKDPPLKYLFEDDHQVVDSAALVYKLYTNDAVHNTFVCTAVSPASESKGELLLGEQYLYFVADKAITDTDYTQMLLGNKDQLSLMWRYSELLEVHCRWYQLQDTALEMFVVTGRSHLLAFTSTADRNQVVGLLQAQLDRPKGQQDQTATHAQRLWLEGSMTNFDYLTFLNKLAGRSFNDLMQYPVFPFVLRDYQNEELDLENSVSFRDLRKPIAVQDKSRERKYKDNYEFLQQEMLKPGPEEVMRVAPFHYGSHYSNSGTVLHYLVRLPPFTRMFLAYQDRSFDIPDRTFHSIRTSWRLSSFESSTDVKELIPEFFFLPEFFTNSEGFDFGSRQNGEVVDDVMLPPWCRGDPRLFVLIHRQALESAVATSMLHHWLDLVFGFKQTGDEAVKAINVFHPSTYFGMDVSSVSDPLKRQALLTMIRTYGQTPKQLFTNPHPAADTTHLTHTASAQHQEKRTYVPRPVPMVNGLRWGRYVGSPELPQPVWQRVSQLPVAITSMVPLVTGPVFGIEAHSTLITLHTKPTGNSYKQTDVLWAGAVTWEHPDSILRVVSHNNKPLVNFMPPNPYDKVTCCAAALDRCLLFVAGASGNISVFNMTHNVAKPSTLHVWGLRRMLCGHQGPITVLQVCKAFGVVVSGSEDSTAIIWDLNRLSYVRTVARHKAAVTVVAVSSTLGDVASVSHLGMGSELQVSTINGSPVGRCRCEAVINSLAYSTAPEGRAVNVIAGGLNTGVVRLWSSWDLTHLRDLLDDSAINRPILSVAYTVNSQALFVSLSDGTIAMWHTDQPSSPANAALFMPVLRHQSY